MDTTLVASRTAPTAFDLRVRLRLMAYYTSYAGTSRTCHQAAAALGLDIYRVLAEADRLTADGWLTRADRKLGGVQVRAFVRRDMHGDGSYGD